MIKIKLLCVGKIKDKYLEEGISEYLKRLSKYASFSVEEVADEKIPENSNESLDNIVKEKESEKIIKKIDGYSILLDVFGKEHTSESFAKDLGNIIDKGNSKITFIICGSLGPSEKLRNLVNERISLSKLTFTHQMTRLIVLEQIYRAFKINSNETYHK